jgi:hypothetical protein
MGNLMAYKDILEYLFGYCQVDLYILYQVVIVVIPIGLLEYDYIDILAGYIGGMVL